MGDFDFYPQATSSNGTSGYRPSTTRTSPRLANFIGADRVLFGSDYPHSEGLAEPADYANQLEGLDDHAVRRIMRENQRELLIP